MEIDEVHQEGLEPPAKRQFLVFEHAQALIHYRVHRPLVLLEERRQDGLLVGEVLVSDWSYIFMSDRSPCQAIDDRTIGGSNDRESDDRPPAY